MIEGYRIMHAVEKEKFHHHIIIELRATNPDWVHLKLYHST